jgi:hypothetical protein
MMFGPKPAPQFSRHHLVSQTCTQECRSVGLNQIVWWLVVGLLAGWAAGQIMKGAGYGVVVDIVLGILGAVLLIWIARLLKAQV